MPEFHGESPGECRERYGERVKQGYKWARKKQNNPKVFVSTTNCSKDSITPKHHLIFPEDIKDNYMFFNNSVASETFSHLLNALMPGREKKK